jgi:hypothetical protein
MKKRKHTEPLFNLMVSEKEKYAHDGQWFKDYTNYVIPYDTSVVEDYHSMKLAYDFVNNNLEGFREEIDRFCNPLDENAFSDVRREELLPYNQIHNNINVQIGDLLGRNDNFKIVKLSDKAVREEQEAYKEQVRLAVEEAVQLQIEKTQMLNQGLSQVDIEKHIEEMRTQMSPEDINQKEFLSDSAIFYQKAIDYAYYKMNIKEMQTYTLRHMLTADRFFIKNLWEFGEPTIRIDNPLYSGFHKSPELFSVAKGDYYYTKRPISVSQAYNLYKDLLTKDELERLSFTGNNSRVDRRHMPGTKHTRAVQDDTTFQMLEGLNGSDDKSIGQSQGNGVNRRYNDERLIWETHLEFVAFRAINFYTYVDEYNESITEIVPDNFEIPEDAVKVKFTNKWGYESSRWEWTDLEGDPHFLEPAQIPRRYEVVRLEEDIFPIMREVPNQPLDIENPYKNFELSTKGRIFSGFNAQSISPVQRAIPYQMQLFYVKHIMNRELAKYQGYVMDVDHEQIPDYLERDENNDKIPGVDKLGLWYKVLKTSGINIYAGTQSADGMPSHTRSPGSKSSLTSSAGDLINLANLAEMLEREVGMALGVSPQRKAMFNAGTNVADNQQAITQSYSITEPIFFMHAQVWKEAINEWLKGFRLYCKRIFEMNPKKKHHFIEYITPQGTKELLKVTPEVLDMEDLGLFLSNSGQDKVYRDVMANYAQAFSQNPEGIDIISGLIKSITNGESPEAIHKQILVEAEKQQQRAAQMQEQQLKSQERMLQMQLENREDEQAHEIEKTLLEIQGELEAIRTKIQAETEKELTIGGESDADGIIDALENSAKLQDMEIQRREQLRKEKETEMKIRAQ